MDSGLSASARLLDDGLYVGDSGDDAAVGGNGSVWICEGCNEDRF